jgi:hypothetical protein
MRTTPIKFKENNDFVVKLIIGFPRQERKYKVQCVFIGTLNLEAKQLFAHL